MNQKTKDIQKRFEGFLQTPSLWKGNTVFDLEQYIISSQSSKVDMIIDEKLRLGKYIERFVSYQIKQDKRTSILCENVQIQEDKQTKGELDFIIQRNKQTIHLEVVYKFYLFEKTIGATEIDCFIGPNRKDSLLEKLSKLKEKQLPLIYSKPCEEYLKGIGLSPRNILQQINFKAQLFVPYTDKDKHFKTINNKCINGYYLNTKQLTNFFDCKFYIPSKKDWLICPYENVTWLNFENYLETCKPILERKFSPLCWKKNPNGQLIKFFLVWW